MADHSITNIDITEPYITYLTEPISTPYISITGNVLNPTSCSIYLVSSRPSATKPDHWIEVLTPIPTLDCTIRYDPDMGWIACITCPASIQLLEATIEKLERVDLDLDLDPYGPSLTGELLKAMQATGQLPSDLTNISNPANSADLSELTDPTAPSDPALNKGEHYELVGGVKVPVFHIPGAPTITHNGVPDDTIRTLPTRIVEFDTATNKWVETGTRPEPEPGSGAKVNPPIAFSEPEHQPHYEHDRPDSL